MSTIKNNINTYADLTAYNADTNKEYPNVSYIQGTNNVLWEKEEPTPPTPPTPVADNIVTIDYVTFDYGEEMGYADNIMAFCSVNDGGVSATETFNSITMDGDELSLATLDNNDGFINNLSTNQMYVLEYTLKSSTVPSRCYQYCAYMQRITLSEGITEIGERAFKEIQSDPNSMVVVDLPSTIETIGNQSFADAQIRAILCEATTPPTLGTEVFGYMVGGDFEIYVPDESVAAYKAASGWSDFSDYIYPLSDWQE